MNKVSDILTSKKYLNGRFFGSGVVRKSVLGQCEHKKTLLSLKLIPTNRSQDFTFPKYIPQIRKTCQACQKWLKFEFQSPELIDRFNQELEHIILEGNKCG